LPGRLTSVSTVFGLSRSIGLYAGWSKRISSSQLEKAEVRHANQYWRESITEFARFLDSCGGLVQSSENAYKYPED